MLQQTYEELFMKVRARPNGLSFETNPRMSDQSLGCGQCCEEQEQGYTSTLHRRELWFQSHPVRALISRIMETYLHNFDWPGLVLL